MRETSTVDSFTMPDGTEFVLARRDQDWFVRAGGRMLMSSRMHDSEEALAARALERVVRPRRVLVGGLGLGYTLRAVLDRIPNDGRVTVAEIVPAVVAWNRTHVSALAGNPLADSRVEVLVEDVFDTIERSRQAFQLILLDVDNGPVGLAQERNERLYGSGGVRACYSALQPGGALAVWSAAPNPRFEKRLAGAGFQVDVLRVFARKGSRGHHFLFLAQRLR